MPASNVPKRMPVTNNRELGAQHDELIKYIHEAWHKVHYFQYNNKIK